ncbi:MAG: AAA family ATPase, partial [Alphaproteobacteria bacterium]|nr:AAA family ATPase [Alphaproteobacteria bacterium]
LSYKKACHVLLNVDGDEWGLHREAVRLANTTKRKKTIEHEPSIFDLRGLRILLVTHINEVPKEVRFVAKRILSLCPPVAEDVHATRRILGLPTLSKEQVSVLIGKPESIMLAGVLKPQWCADDTRALLELEHSDEEGPSLFDVPGFEEQKVWARSLAKDIKLWRQGKLGWKDIGQSALVSGPPGVGKTYFASALSSALGFRLIQATVGGWQSGGYLNDMLAAMRRSFDEAKASGGAVLFIDEFDSIGSRPTRPTGRPNETYWQVVINEFLSLMNAPGEGVIVIGATNFPEWIDPAILRAGRIEKHFKLGLPDTTTRAEILRYHTGGSLPFESLTELADDLEGKSAAALEELVRSARRLSRNEDRELQLRDLRAVMPERKGYSPEEQFRLGVHEAGHALIALTLNCARSATIEIRDTFDVSPGSYMRGRTSYDLFDDNLPTESVLLNRIAMSLAGMAAEAVVFGDRSLGSGGLVGSDVEHATSIARRLVGSYGLGDTPYFFATPEELDDERMPPALEAESMKILRTQYERVIGILFREKEHLISLAAEAVAHGKVLIERDLGLECCSHDRE